MRKPISAYSNRRWLLQGLYLILVAAIFTSALGVLVYRWVNPGITMLMVNKHYNALKEGRYETIKKNWVRIENISPNMLLAAVSAEDSKFTEHWGFDFESIRKAVASNKRSKRVKGASTISQQTAKNVFLWPTRSWVRKGFEAYFTLLVEALWTKERIIEVYLNVAELGKGIYGVERAAQEYYKKPASTLTRAEAAMLTSVLPNPARRNPVKPTTYMVRYQQRVLRNMNNLQPLDFSRGDEEKKTPKSKPRSKKSK